MGKYRFLAVTVTAEKIEETHKWLTENGLLDRTRKIRVFPDNTAEIPVTGNPGKFRMTEQSNPEFYRRYENLKERLRGRLPADLLNQVPSGWHVIGEAIVVSIPEEIITYSSLIGETLLEMYPSCRCVVGDKGIRGPLRQPEREVIAGAGTETLHRENGCLFRLDVTKVMFSKGNLHEKKRMSRLGSGETVIDMFAGIGYFSIPMAVHAKPRRVIAIELNPESYAFLLENIRLNNVKNIIEPVQGDCMEKTPEGIADRVLMGYVGKTHEFLPVAVRAIKKEGGILHYHEAVPEKLFPDRPAGRVREAAGAAGRNSEILTCRKIKKYSPGVWHVVVDAGIH